MLWIHLATVKLRGICFYPGSTAATKGTSLNQVLQLVPPIVFACPPNVERIRHLRGTGREHGRTPRVRQLPSTWLYLFQVSSCIDMYWQIAQSGSLMKIQQEGQADLLLLVLCGSEGMCLSCRPCWLSQRKDTSPFEYSRLRLVLANLPAKQWQERHNLILRGWGWCNVPLLQESALYITATDGE